MIVYLSCLVQERFLQFLSLLDRKYSSISITLAGEGNITKRRTIIAGDYFKGKLNLHLLSFLLNEEDIKSMGENIT